MVFNASGHRCRNGHPILATSAYCLTCGAPIIAPPPGPTRTQLYALTAPTPDAAAPRPLGHPVWTILNPWAILTVVILATGVALLAVAVASQL